MNFEIEDNFVFYINITHSVIYSTGATKSIFTTKFWSTPFIINFYEVLYTRHFTISLKGTIKT